MNFLTFKEAVGMRFSMMSKGELFVTDVTKDELWDTYLSSFPEGTNPLFRERTQHDCQYCKTFIRGGGNVVTITDDYELQSIWDIEIDGPYQEVANALSALVKSRAIAGVYRYFQKNLGTDHNHELVQADFTREIKETVKRWDHFHFRLPNKFVHDGTGNPQEKSKEEKTLLKRSLDEITLEAINTVLELIEQGSLYRGEEYKSAVENFKKFKLRIDGIVGLEKVYDVFLWSIVNEAGALGRMKNTVIGTLLVDISKDMELDKAVYRFNHKMDPERFKRPVRVATKGMILKAEEKVTELGYMNSLARRHAEVDDITINNVLFANPDAKKAMNVFESLAAEIVDTKEFSKLEEVSADTFINDILPKAENVEVYFDNCHENNLMSLVAPLNPGEKNMLKWGNNFSWAYKGEVADSIKEKVRVAGGNVDGVLRCSLSWFNGDDLDIHVQEPGRNGSHIYFDNKRMVHRSSGVLDVDMNAGSANTRKPVENIVYTQKEKMPQGMYHVYVNQYSSREDKDIGFILEMEYEGRVWTYRYDKPQKSRSNVTVVKFNFSRKNGIKIIESIRPDDGIQNVWGINTSQFHRVSVIMNSPNHWDGEKTGNKHLFFILEGCKNDEPVRGFFNEFLNDDLHEHRRVFEMLGHKMKAEPSERQLSGLGFSSTRRSSVVCKVTGAFTRTLKVNF